MLEAVEEAGEAPGGGIEGRRWQIWQQEAVWVLRVFFWIHNREREGRDSGIRGVLIIKNGCKSGWVQN